MGGIYTKDGRPPKFMNDNKNPISKSQIKSQ